MKKFVAVISPDASLQTQLRFLFSQFFLSSLISLFLYDLFLSFVYFISLCAAISSPILFSLFLYSLPLFLSSVSSSPLFILQTSSHTYILFILLYILPSFRSYLLFSSLKVSSSLFSMYTANSSLTIYLH